MEISVVFNTFEEMEEFAEKVLANRSKEVKAEPKKVEPKKAEEAKAPVEEPKAEAKAETKAPEEEPKAKAVTESDIKVLLSNKLKAGKKAQVKDLLTKYGVDKLSELIAKHPDKLDEFYKEVEEI